MLDLEMIIEKSEMDSYQNSPSFVEVNSEFVSKYTYMYVYILLFSALERNVSLSGAYLEELSVQYKKQIEELQKEVHKGEEALVVASKERERDRANQRLLHDQIGQLKIVVEEVSTRMETMSTWVKSQIATLN